MWTDKEGNFPFEENFDEKMKSAALVPSNLTKEIKNQILASKR